MSKFASRKLIVTMITLAALLLCAALGVKLQPEVVYSVVGGLAAYLGAQGHVDAKSALVSAVTSGASECAIATPELALAEKSAEGEATPDPMTELAGAIAKLVAQAQAAPQGGK